MLIESSGQWVPTPHDDALLPRPAVVSSRWPSWWVPRSMRPSWAEPHILGVSWAGGAPCTPGPSYRWRGSGNQIRSASPAYPHCICPLPHNGVGVLSPGFAESRGPER